MASMTAVLVSELMQLEGLHGQDPETGAGVHSSTSYLSEYTNRIFGAPYQLLDSVDRRFPSVNEYVGNEYLRNFLLNSPILHIKPGLPKYTGKEEGLLDSIKQVYIDTSSGNMSFASALLEEMASSTIFGKGSQLQKRMFGFRETYYQYMQHVNYMCRSMASFIGLVNNTKFPNGTFTGESASMKPFKTMKWENYRMLSKTTVTTPWDQLQEMGGATLVGAAAGSVGDIIGGLVTGVKKSAKDTAKALTEILIGGSSASDVLGDLGSSLASDAAESAGSMWSDVKGNFSHALSTSITDVAVDKVSSVQFMVEPVQFDETLINNVEDSMIESTIDGVTKGIGSEIAFITGSNVDFGLVEGITDFLGNTLESAATMIQGLVKPVVGGFASNLFSGALRSIKGQKMIYPKIYKSSESTMNYQFTINLNSPYGDPYNYYMNIVVPLMHLIALAAPRMITSNSIASPFLVQAFIPGMCTCQLGIIQQMNISKNPSTKHVSVHGFPLDVKVTFTIQELYNALSISPANDPASFLFNETLNDYMSNLAGLMPSVDTYTEQRKIMFQNLQNYFESSEYLNDIANNLLTKVENTFNPFQGR